MQNSDPAEIERLVAELRSLYVRTSIYSEDRGTLHRVIAALLAEKRRADEAGKEGA